MSVYQKNLIQLFCFIVGFFLFMKHEGLMAKENVILLHGLLRTDKSFAAFEKKLQEENYHAVNQSYPSRDFEVEDLAMKFIDQALDKCIEGEPVHFVTHSMGGILLRYYLTQKGIKNLGHVVMLGPPNQGSEVVDKLGDLAIFKWVNGPAGSQLGTDEASLPKQMGKANFSLGVIAGDKSFNLLLSCLLPGKDDGKVTVENTKLEGMTDHIVIPTTHIFMMQNKKVWDQILHFLVHGKFDHPTK